MRCFWLALTLAGPLALPAHADGPRTQSSLALTAPTAVITDNSNRIATTAYVQNVLGGGIPLASGKIFIGSVGNLATPQTMSGDCTISIPGVITCTQAAGNFQVIGNLTVGGSIIDGNGVLMTNIAAPATPAAGTTRVYVDSTQKVLTFKNDVGTVGNAVIPSTAPANQFANSISAAGVVGYTQPSYSNISGTVPAVTSAQLAAGPGISVSGTCTITTTGTCTIANGLVVTKQVFTATGTYTPTTGMAYAMIECIGGGGGGGGSNANANNTDVGGGGGAGSYSRVYVTAAAVGASKAVTIGTGGTAGTAAPGAGGGGGDTSVGALCVGKGGSGGSAGGGGGANVAGGGTGGIAGTGDLAIPGNGGGPGIAFTALLTAHVPSMGGAGHFGGQTKSSTGVNNNGAAGAANSGAGGNGGDSYNVASNTGGVGGTGVVVITEFVKP